MIKSQIVYDQLKKIGINPRGWGSAAISELPSILMPQETITALVNGWYENGFAALVATNMRLLLVDKKLLHLTIEDVRYDMIAEVDYNAQLFDATIHVTTVNKELKFTSTRQRRLRALCNHVQHRVMEVRHHNMNFAWQQFEEIPVEPARPPQAVATPNMSLPLGSPSDFQMPQVRHPYSKVSLTTKRNFLPKIPRRLRPDTY